jgi:hypothetical protein
MCLMHGGVVRTIIMGEKMIKKNRFTVITSAMRGPYKTRIWENPSPDMSWKTEFDDFELIIRNDENISRSQSMDARYMLKVVAKTYGEAP